MKKKVWHVRMLLSAKEVWEWEIQLPKRVKMSSSGVYLQINMFSKILMGCVLAAELVVLIELDEAVSRSDTPS